MTAVSAEPIGTATRVPSLVAETVTGGSVGALVGHAVVDFPAAVFAVKTSRAKASELDLRGQIRKHSIDYAVTVNT